MRALKSFLVLFAVLLVAACGEDGTLSGVNTTSAVYTVTFNVDGITSTKNVIYGSPLGANMHDDPIKTGHVFVGWNTSPSATEANFGGNTPVDTDITVYAIWAINSYTVTFNVDGVISAKNVNHSSPLGANMHDDPIKTGHVFVGWNTSPSATEANFGGNTPVDTDITVYAIWAINSYTVTFNVDGITSTKNVIYGSSLGANMHDDPIKTGHVFVGWNTSPSATEANFGGNTPVDTDITVYAIWTVGTEGMVYISGGTFTMGSPSSEVGYDWYFGYETEMEIQREVTIGAFYMGRYEVTQAEWKAVMGDNPSWFTPANVSTITDSSQHPVERVSWYAAIRYCNKRSVLEGLTPVYSIGDSADETTWGATPTTGNSKWNAVKANWSANGYRLPTEAEWEYAARAGTTTAFNTGENITADQANFHGDYPYDPTDGYIHNPDGVFLERTAPVGSYAPNAWGLYDMHGNVFEWVWDWFGAYNMSDTNNPKGLGSGFDRVTRGGSWHSLGLALRSAFREDASPSISAADAGFRVVRSE